MALSTLLVWAAGLGALAYALLHRRRYVLAARIPGPKLWLPLIGNLIDTILHYGFGNIDWLWGYYKRFGNVYCMYIGPNLTFITSDPADVEAITTNPNLIDKGSEYSLLIPWLGEGLLLRGGNTWHSRRKLLTPTFHFRILDQFLDVFNEKAVVLESKLQTLVGQDPVDMRSYLSRFTLDVICETAMGTPTNAQTNEDSEFVKAVKTACRTTIYRYRLPWLRNDAIFRMSQAGKDFYSALEVMHSTVREVIKTRKEGVQMELREGSKEANLNTEDDIGSKKRIVFIDQLLTMHLQGEDLSEKDIFDEVNTFMFAGHDTTMTSMSFTLFLLAKHPAVQQRVVEEVIEVTEGSGNITSATLSQLKYLEAVIKESLRLYPSAPVFFRECTSELSLPSGYTVPAGSSIMVNLMVMHYDEKNFREPLKFDPDRFLSGTEEKRHHFAYIPFSAGYRNCIGQKFAMLSMKTVLARILRSFRFVLPSENSEIHLDMEVVLTAKSIPLVIQRR